MQNNANEHLLPGETPVKDKAYFGKRIGGGCFGCLFVIFVLAWIVQGFLYALATTMNGCRKGPLEGYNYESAGGMDSAKHDASYNILPKMSYLTEKPHVIWGQSFTVMPTNEFGVISSPIGTWWKAWGPIFNTYVYQDILNSKTTIYMRQKLLRFGQSHQIARCDGEGPTIVFEEGMNFFGNRVRNALGLTQSFSYKIFMDGEFVATAEEANTGYSSITIVNVTGGREQIADAILEARNYGGHNGGNMDKWLIKNHKSNDLPYYVINAAGLLYAFHEMNNEKAVVGPSPSPAAPPAPGSFFPLEVAAQPAAAAVSQVENQKDTELMPVDQDTTHV